MKFQANRYTDILLDLRSFGLDDNEAIETLRSSLSASGSSSSSNRTYSIYKGDEVVAQATYNKKGALRSLSIRSDLWRDAKQLISEDLQDNITQVARSVFLTYREVKGFYSVPGWIQIRPVAIPLSDRTTHHALSLHTPASAPLPFAVEVFYRWSKLAFLEAHRRLHAVKIAQWLLGTFIDIPVFSLTTPYTWAFLDYSYALVACGISHGLDEAPQDAFSDVLQIPQLIPIPMSEYYASLGIGSSDFRVPDINALYTKYLALTNAKKTRFLRCCASIYAASNPAIKEFQRLVSLVSAIEPLLNQGKRCKTCQSYTGITQEFRNFLDSYIQPTPEIRHLYEAVYSYRSKIVHGGWNPEVDEPFFSLKSDSHITGLAAWAAAKQGAINWLNAQ